MTFEEAILIVESDEFEFRIGIVSGLESLLGAAREEDAVRVLSEGLSFDVNQLNLLLRVFRFASQDFDFRYRHPRDITMAVYAWLLSACNQTYALMAAGSIKKSPMCWWAERVAQQIFSQSKLRTDASIADTLAESRGYPSRITAKSPQSEERILFSGVRFRFDDAPKGLSVAAAYSSVNENGGQSVIFPSQREFGIVAVPAATVTAGEATDIAVKAAR